MPLENDVSENVAKSLKKPATKKPVKKTIKKAPSTPKKPVKKPQGDTIFALDIGTRTVVGILGHYVDEKYYIIDCEVVPHTKRAMVDGQIEDIKQVAKIVSIVKNNLEERNHIKLKEVSIAAAGRALKTVHQAVDFDVTDKTSITDVMVNTMEIEVIQKAQHSLDTEQQELSGQFYCVGHSVLEYKLDNYKIISLEGHKGSVATIDIIAAFLPSVVVEGLYAVMDANELEVSSLTLEPIAAMNVIVPPEIRFINIALIDIGAGTSDIAIAKNGSIVAYAMATIAGDEISEDIIKTFFVDFNMAEDMKAIYGSGVEEIPYKDIFGRDRTVSTLEFAEKIQYSVLNLAKTICKVTMAVNNGSPAAVFLIGGGSLVAGLQDIVAKEMGIDASRVAIGGQEFLKNVEAGTFKLGAEFVTPIGIGFTNILNQGYDFSTITLNNTKIRIFDTKHLTVFDLLTMAGYKSTDIMGRSGRNLPYMLNGKRITEHGTSHVPAAIYLNDVPAAITNRVSQGDKIRFSLAINGTDAKLKLGEIIDFSNAKSGSVAFKDTIYKIGLEAYVNGNPETPSYEIMALDSIVTKSVTTLRELLFSLNEPYTEWNYNINGKTAAYDTKLNDGDIIAIASKCEVPVIEEEIAIEEPLEAEQATENVEEVEVSEKASVPFRTKYKPDEYRSISITLNGRRIELQETDGYSKHQFLDLLNIVNIDLTKPQGNIILTLNGRDAAFTDVLQENDVAVIKWDSSK